MLTDHELIARMLDDYEEQLSDRERGAFEDMRPRAALTEKQRGWVRSVAERLGIQVAPARNVFSSMPEAQRREHLSQVRTCLPWECSGYSKVLRPPGK